jgi:hypothetical protein
MTSDDIEAAQLEARAMLDAFTSVGADTLDVTITTRQGAKLSFRRGVRLEKLIPAIPAELKAACRSEHNIIVRPHAPDVVFIQLDDLRRAVMQRIWPAAFLCLETSPQNYQAWLAMQHVDDNYARRLRTATGADPTASGATRLAGSVNFKEKYAPDFPRVRVIHTSPGRIASKEQLTGLGVVETPTRDLLTRCTAAPPPRRVKRWPSYQLCIAGAPARREGGHPDISRADFTWCMIAIDWGWSIKETAGRLMEESPKARENGERYAFLTAQRAATAVTADSRHLPAG